MFFVLIGVVEVHVVAVHECGSAVVLCGVVWCCVVLYCCVVLFSAV